MRPRSALVFVPVLFSCSRSSATDPIVQIAAGVDLTCARTQSGAVLCWGDDASTSRSITTADLPVPRRARPRPVQGVKDAIDLDVAASLGCVVDRGGALLCWTDTTNSQRANPMLLAATPTGVTGAAAVTLGVAPMPNACVRKVDGTVTCLSVDRQAMPRDERPEDGLSGVESFEVGDAVQCAVRTGGKLTCWGPDPLGPKEQALAGPPLLEGVRDLSVGSAFACAVDLAGKVSCFGLDKGTPPAVPARLVRAGVYHACLVDTEGHVRCWGDDRFGQLGRSGPDGVEGVQDAIDVAVGAWHTCALERSGKVLCWGRNSRGQLGDDSTKDRKEAREIDRD